MDATQIVHELAVAERLPVEAIQAARAERTAVAPEFVRVVEQAVRGEVTFEGYCALFLIFHLLGEWREKSAYRPLAALLRLPTEQIEDILGDAITDTSHRVMAAVFQGDPEPLYDIIRDADADEIVRTRMCDALAMVTLRGELPREEAARFLRTCYSELEAQASAVWDGWQSAIAMLGLVDLVPLVKQAFERELIDPQLADFEEFEQELHRTINGGSSPDWHAEREFELFGDTLEELSTWAYSDREDDSDEYLEEDEDEWEPRERIPAERMLWGPSEGPAVNPYKDVGRNDPCPCGSGKKFKKCCLGKSETQPPAATSGSRKRHDLVTALHAALPSDDPDIPIEGDYDPLVAPDPDEWLALDEQERIEAVTDFHRRARIRVPNAKVHAVIHVVVENQIAEGDGLPVRRTLERLMGEDLDRHEAIHAIGMVLIGHMNDLMKAGDVEGDPNLPYYVELERLTAAEWRRSR
jgi:hypothetical protein